MKTNIYIYIYIYIYKYIYMYKDVRFDVKVLKRFCLIIFLIDYST